MVQRASVPTLGPEDRGCGPRDGVKPELARKNPRRIGMVPRDARSRRAGGDKEV